MERPTSLGAEDRGALVELAHRYAARVDDRDPAGAAALFTVDGVLARAEPPRHLGPVHEDVGPAAIEAALGALREVPQTVHEVVGTVLDPDPDFPDVVHGRIACVAHHLLRGEQGTTDLVWHLRYLDTYRRTPGGWRIQRRELHIDFIETRPVRRTRTDPQEDR